MQNHREAGVRNQRQLAAFYAGRSNPITLHRHWPIRRVCPVRCVRGVGHNVPLASTEISVAHLRPEQALIGWYEGNIFNVFEGLAARVSRGCTQGGSVASCQGPVAGEKPFLSYNANTGGRHFFVLGAAAARWCKSLWLLGLSDCGGHILTLV